MVTIAKWFNFKKGVFMSQDAKQILRQMVDTELSWIANMSHTTDKDMVKDEAVRWILNYLHRKKIEIKYGSGGIAATDIQAAVKKTNVYRFAAIVDTAETKEELIRLIIQEWDQDKSTQSVILTRPWDYIRTLYNIHWKFHFPYPKGSEAEESLLRRHKSKPRGTKDSRPVPPPAPVEKVWTEYIPEEFREVVQLASNLPKDNHHIFKMLEKETSPFQRTLIRTILMNPFNEKMVSEFGIKVQSSTSEWYKIMISNITAEVIKMGMK